MAYGNINVNTNQPTIQAVKESEIDKVPNNTFFFMIKEDKK